MKKISTLFLIAFSFITIAKAQLFTITSISPTAAAAGSNVTMTITGGSGVTFNTTLSGCTCANKCVAVNNGASALITIANSTNTMTTSYNMAVTSGANTCTITFTIPPSQASGVYNFSLTGINGCLGFLPNAFTITSSTSGISNIENSNFNIFPNPSKGIFDVQLNNFSSTNYADVFDLLGRKVETFTLSSEKTQVDASSFGKGVYFISIRNEKGIVGRQKLVIE